MKRLFRLLLALMVSASMIFVAVSCDEGASSSGSKKDDDEDEEVYEEAVWTEFDDVEFIKLLESYDGCDKVKYEEGWDDSEELDAEDDVSKDAAACTYRIKTEDGDIYLFMELEDDELTARGMIDIEGEECDEDDATKFLEELADGYSEEPSEEPSEDPSTVPSVEPEPEPEPTPSTNNYGEKAYGRFYFGMSMSEAEYVIDGDYEIDGDSITITDWYDEYYDEDYSITGYVNCDYISLDFSDDSLYSVYVSTESDLSESEADTVFEYLVDNYGYDYEYDSDYDAYYWYGDEMDVSAYIDYYDGVYGWNMFFKDYDYS